MGKIVKTAKPGGGIWTAFAANAAAVAAGKATSRRTTTHSRINWLNYSERKRNREIDRDGKGQSKGKRWHGKLTKPRQRSRRECSNSATAAAAALVRRICNLFLTVWRGLHCRSKGVLAGREACKIYLPWLLMPQSRASRGQTQRRRQLSHCCWCWWCIFEQSPKGWGYVAMWLRSCHIGVRR